MNDKESERKNFFEKINDNSIEMFIVAALVSFFVSKLLDFVLVKGFLVFVFVAYLIFLFICIGSKSIKPLLNFSKKIILGYLFFIPLAISGITAVYMSFFYKTQGEDYYAAVFRIIADFDAINILILVFFLMLAVCYFVIYSLEKLKVSTDKILSNEGVTYEKIEECVNEISSISLNSSKKIIKKIDDQIINNQENNLLLENINKKIDEYSEVAYTTTCIPIKYNKEDKKIFFCLIENKSHSTKKWMFPGGHVDVAKNTLSEEFEFNEIEITPQKIIEKKVEDEAGLQTFKLIDNNYGYANSDIVDCEPEDRYEYPNTCWPVKGPIFNYLFRVSDSSNCNTTRGHRCHYDFTYIGEYNSINDDKENKYNTIEVGFGIFDYDFDKQSRYSIIGDIEGTLSRKINTHLRGKGKGKGGGRESKDNLFFDSIPELIYNAMRFYIDYKKIRKQDTMD